MLKWEEEILVERVKSKEMEERRDGEEEIERRVSGPAGYEEGAFFAYFQTMKPWPDRGLRQPGITKMLAPNSRIQLQLNLSS